MENPCTDSVIQIQDEHVPRHLQVQLWLGFPASVTVLMTAKISVFSCLINGQQHGTGTREMQLNQFLIHAHTWGFCCDFWIFLVWSNDQWKADKSKTPGRASVEEGRQKVLQCSPCLKKSLMALIVIVGKGFYFEWCWDTEFCSCWPALLGWFWRLSWWLETCHMWLPGPVLAWAISDVLWTFLEPFSTFVCYLINTNCRELLKTH